LEAGEDQAFVDAATAEELRSDLNIGGGVEESAENALGYVGVGCWVMDHVVCNWRNELADVARGKVLQNNVVGNIWEHLSEAKRGGVVFVWVLDCLGLGVLVLEKGVHVAAVIREDHGGGWAQVGGIFLDDLRASLRHFA
jgi:hypothetical protein